MTLPMPGPPQWHESTGLGDWDAQGRWRNRWNIYHADGRAEYEVAERHVKRLTTEGCAAHYWRAMHNVLRYDDGDPGQNEAIRRAEVWQRFKDTPHALEEA